MADIKFSARAYCKMVLHAAKYPHCAVNGVLLAEDQKSKEDRKGRNVFICDAIPLFHICLHLTPMAEIALTQIDHMASASGLVVAGYYQANENIRDLSYEKVGQRIADKIAENFSSACLVIAISVPFNPGRETADKFCSEASSLRLEVLFRAVNVRHGTDDFTSLPKEAILLQIDNRRLSLNMENVALCVSQFIDGKWKSKEKSSFSLENNSRSVTATLLQGRSYEMLIDFDNHLDDISQDCRNPSLNELIEEEIRTDG